MRRCCAVPWLTLPVFLLGCSALFGLEDLTIGETSTTGVGGTGAGGSTGGGGTGGQAGHGATGGGGQGGSAPTPWTHVWSTSFSGPGMDTSWDVAIGSGDAIVVAGGYQQTLMVGTQEHTAQGDDPFVAVGTANGQTWDSESFSSLQNQAITGIAVAGDGSLFVSGLFYGALALDGCSNLTSAHAIDIFVVKLDSGFVCQWAHNFGQGVIYNPEFADFKVAIDPAGQLLASGHFADTIDLPGMTAPLTAAGSADVYVLRFDAGSGDVLDSNSFGQAGNASPKDLAVDDSGNVYLAGWFDGAIPLDIVHNTAGDADAFVAKLNAALEPQWSISAGDALKQSAVSVAVDGSGNVVVGGYHRGTIDLGGGGLTSPADRDAWLARFDTDGQHLFSESYGAAGDQVIAAVATDDAGRMVITGESKGEVDFGGGALQSDGNTGIFLASFDASGTHQRSMLVGTQGTLQAGVGIALTSDGQTVLTGIFDGTVDFGANPLSTAGGTDVFVARLGP